MYGSNCLSDIALEVIGQFFHYLVRKFAVELLETIEDQPHVQIEHAELDGEIWRNFKFLSKL